MPMRSEISVRPLRGSLASAESDGRATGDPDHADFVVVTWLLVLGIAAALWLTVEWPLAPETIWQLGNFP